MFSSLHCGDSEIAIRDDIAISYQYCMPGATHYVLSNGNSALLVLVFIVPFDSSLQFDSLIVFDSDNLS